MAEFTQEELEAEAAGFEEVAQQEAQDGREQAEQAEAETVERERDEQGRFAPTAKEVLENAKEQEETRERPKTVPHGALHAEREGHKATRAELQQAKDQLSQLQALRDRIAAARAEQPAAVDVGAPQEGADAKGDDPAALRHLANRLQQTEARLHERDTREQEYGVAQQENQVLHSSLMQSEAAFRATTPDYNDAAQHLAQARANQLQLMGMSQHEVMETLSAEVMEITRAAIEQGRDPAEVAYQWAKTYGYQPQGGNAAPAQKQQEANPMLAAIANGQKQSRSLNNARGGSSSAEVNANSIANMSEEEFGRLYDSPEGRKLLASIG